MGTNNRRILKETVTGFRRKKMEVEAKIKNVNRIEKKICPVEMGERIKILKNKGKLRRMKEATHANSDVTKTRRKHKAKLKRRKKEETTATE